MEEIEEYIDKAIVDIARKCRVKSIDIIRIIKIKFK
jgi:hypothetical protein